MDIQETIVARILAAQEEGNPLKIYRKNIIGKVSVRVIDHFTGNPTEVLIPGSTKNVDPSDLEINLWTPLQVQFFEKYNRRLIESGTLIPVKESESFSLEEGNIFTDEEIDLIIKNYRTLKSKLEDITSEKVAFRFLTAAREADRPIKTVDLIKKRIEELQQK